MSRIGRSGGPRTVTGIQNQSIELPRRLGMFIELMDHDSIGQGVL